ncbi:hypothetical protein HK102_000631, partial [Quaeritorhiza haematococci]
MSFALLFASELWGQKDLLAPASSKEITVVETDVSVEESCEGYDNAEIGQNSSAAAKCLISIEHISDTSAEGYSGAEEKRGVDEPSSLGEVLLDVADLDTQDGGEDFKRCSRKTRGRHKRSSSQPPVISVHRGVHLNNNPAEADLPVDKTPLAVSDLSPFRSTKPAPSFPPFPHASSSSATARPLRIRIDDVDHPNPASSVAKVKTTTSASQHLGITTTAKHTFPVVTSASSKHTKTPFNILAFPCALAPKIKRKREQKQHHQHQYHGHQAHRQLQQAPFKSFNTRQSALSPLSLEIRKSKCGTFTCVAETFAVPLMDNPGGFIPMDRRCSPDVYAQPSKAKGAVILIPGFASNRRIFDCGGGQNRKNGKDGTKAKGGDEITGGDESSFIEYLAKHGYDAFSIDLRGSIDSKALGGGYAPCAADLSEYVESDIPSAIACIKAITAHQKVYIIGHSMGGLLSCAFAGMSPEDVCGVVHVAGVYQMRIPGIDTLANIYNNHVSDRVKALIRTGASATYKGMTKLVQAKLSISPYLSSFLTNLKRQQIPLRTVISIASFLKAHVLPSQVAETGIEHLGPWLPYTVEDPWKILDTAVESPSVGTYLGLLKMMLIGMQVRDLSHGHGATVAHHSDSKSRDGRREKTSVGPSEAAEVKAREVRRRKRGFWSWIIASVFYYLTGKLNRHRNRGNTHTTLQFKISSHAAPQPIEVSVLQGIPAVSSSPNATTTTTTTPPSSPIDSSWNELAPYLARFEKLQHLPLFFCYADQDRVLKPVDTMAGYRRSGSRWKDVIEYVRKEEYVLDEGDVEEGGAGGGVRRIAIEHKEGVSVRDADVRKWTTVGRNGGVRMAEHGHQEEEEESHLAARKWVHVPQHDEEAGFGMDEFQKVAETDQATMPDFHKRAHDRKDSGCEVSADEASNAPIDSLSLHAWHRPERQMQYEGDETKPQQPGRKEHAK